MKAVDDWDAALARAASVPAQLGGAATAKMENRIDALQTELDFHEANRGERHDRTGCVRCRLIAFLAGEGETVDEPRLRHQPFPARVLVRS